jgi:hypothetical protein
MTDLRDPSTTPLNFTKSINLALSERGINAMRQSGRLQMLERIFSETIPMRGRMIHGKDSTGKLYEQPQDYDIHGKVATLRLYPFIKANMILDHICSRSRRAQQRAPRRIRFNAQRYLFLQPQTHRR